MTYRQDLQDLRHPSKCGLRDQFYLDPPLCASMHPTNLFFDARVNGTTGAQIIAIMDSGYLQVFISRVLTK